MFEAFIGIINFDSLCQQGNCEIQGMNNCKSTGELLVLDWIYR